MKRAIVTGANGFVGSAIIKVLEKHGYDVVAVLRNEQSDVEKLQNTSCQRVFCELGDLDSLELKLQGMTYDSFFHCAWEGSAGNLRFDSVIQLKNVEATLAAIKVAKKLGCSKFIGAGSIMEDESIAVTLARGKSMPKQYIYGAAKFSAHMLSKAIASDLEIDHLWPKITNAYGPNERSPRFINTTLRKILSKQELEFTAGTQNYDFIYIDDVAMAFYSVAKNGVPNSDYIVGSGEAQPLRNFIERIGRLLIPGQTIKFGDIPFTGVNVSLETFSTKALNQDTGFIPSISFEEGILRTFDDIKKREA